MRITVTDLRGFRVFADRFEKIISIVDPGLKLSFQQGDHCIVRCDDISTDTVVSPDGITLSGYVIPQEHHVQEILSYSANFKNDDKILIHCHAGISRSTAAAILVLCQHGMSPKEALKQIQEERPILWPNDRFIVFGDKILGLQGELTKTVSEWKAEETGTVINLTHTKVAQEDIDEMQSFKDLFD